MRSKHYQSIKTKAPQEVVGIEDALKWLKENSRKKFDETIEIHIHLNIEPGQSNQVVRGNVTLPSGTPKQKNVVVIKNDAASLKLLKQIEEDGSLDADVVVATPDMMSKIAKVAKILGPRGLMPNPKTGTVTPEPEKVVAELSAGKISFKMDELGNLHEAVGKQSWEIEKTAANVAAFLEAVKAARPEGAKGKLIKTVSLKSTMSPSIRITA